VATVNTTGKISIRSSTQAYTIVCISQSEQTDSRVHPSSYPLDNEEENCKCVKPTTYLPQYPKLRTCLDIPPILHTLSSCGAEASIINARFDILSADEDSCLPGHDTASEWRMFRRCLQLPFHSQLSTLKTEASRSSETSTAKYQSTRITFQNIFTFEHRKL
jgi:hypothetical protein